MEGLTGSVWLNDVSTLAGYLMPNPIYIYIYMCVCVCVCVKANSQLANVFPNEIELIFCTQLHDFKCCEHY